MSITTVHEPTERTLTGEFVVFDETAQMFHCDQAVARMYVSALVQHQFSREVPADEIKVPDEHPDGSIALTEGQAQTAVLGLVAMHDALLWQETPVSAQFAQKVIGAAVLLDAALCEAEDRPFKAVRMHMYNMSCVTEA